MGYRLGRYEVLGRLATGTEGTVFRCRDPELDRTVAVKLLRRNAGYGNDLDQPHFHEARMMSRIQHPNIVTIYDVGLRDQTPFLVFEFVQGERLCDVLRQRRLGMGELMDLTQGILEGVAEAHRCGVVHRDLKPSNIIVSGERLAKIMDFGIAQVVDQAEGGDARVMGTPPYLAPEYVREGRVSAAMDVFAVGAIVYEMVAGQAPFSGETPEAVCEQVLGRQPRPLNQLEPEVDERFSALITKALEKDPDARFRDAGEMLEALRAFRAAFEEMGGEPGGRSRSATVEFLIRRMQRNQDFPALSGAITTLNRLVSSDDEDVAPLSHLIVKDYALTSKILKVVNSAYYNRFAGGVGTISRAIVVLGTEAVRSIAASLIFFEHLHNKTQVDRLKARVTASLFSAVLARRFAEQSGEIEVEEYLLCAMLNRLGELLVTYYLADESRDVERLLQGGLEACRAQRKVLGATYEEIGMQVAREWNFPEQTIQSMRSIDPGAGSPGAPAPEMRHLMANFSNEVVDVLKADGEETNPGLDAILARYHAALGMGREDFDALLKGSSEEFLVMVEEWGNVGSSAPILGAIERRLGGGRTLPKAPAPDDGCRPETRRQPERVLANGLQEVTSLLLEAHTLTQVFNVVIEAMYRAMGFERVLLTLRNPRDEVMVARLGFGADIEDYMRRFQFPTRHAPDVFHVALEENVDVHISDTLESGVRAQLPAWYQALGSVGSFLVFPVVVHGRAVGMIYGDHPDSHGFDLTPYRLDLLKALRNQASMAVLLSMNGGRS